jgi:pimeloyl-ACP methyl ester carboxylesterase
VILLVWILFVPLVASVPPCFAATFLERVNEEFALQESYFDPSLLKKIQSKHVVFVDGFMNEGASILGNYFFDSMSQLKDLGISYSHLGFSSLSSIPNNAEELYFKIKEIFRIHKKPIILVGHSMGGAESLYLMLRCYDMLLLGTIDRVVSIQGAIGGSPIVEQFADNIVAQGMKKLFGESVDSLRPEVARWNFQAAFDVFQVNLLSIYSGLGTDFLKSTYEELSRRVFYVRSAHPEEKNLSLGLNIVMNFLKSGVFGDVRNDVLMGVDDQILGIAPLLIQDQTGLEFLPFGIDLGVLEADHIELVISGFTSNSNENYRKAFTRALFKSIYDDPVTLEKASPVRTYWKKEWESLSNLRQSQTKS